MLVGRNAQVGGGSTFRLNVGSALRERGNQVSIAALGGPMVARYRGAGLRWHWVPPHPLCAGLLVRALRADGVDVVHASNTTAGDAALAGAERLGLPLVVSLHNTITGRESRHVCLKRARRIVVFDAGAEASARAFEAEFDPGKITRIPRPVAHAPADPAAIAPDRIVYISRLSRRKGRVALSFLEAFAMFARGNRAASLVVLGDGSMRREVAAAAARVARDAGVRVEVRGQMVDPAPAVAPAGVVVGAGYAALEALMQGRAVIGAGFHGYGAVTGENLLDAVQCNFGDSAARWESTPENFLEALRRLQAAWEGEERSRYWGLDRTLAPLHSAPAVAARLEAIYREALGER